MFWKLLTVMMGMAIFLGAPEAKAQPATTQTQTTKMDAAELERAYAQLDRAMFGPEWNRKVDAFAADNAKREPGGIVMAGDSITEFLDTNAAFPGLNVANRGISGDIIIGLITRRKESFLDLKPSRLFILIGINNIAPHTDITIEEYERQYRALFNKIKKGLPGTKVYIQSVMPVIPREDWRDPNPRVRKVNALLEKLTKEYEFKYINLDTVMANETGDMKTEYTDDRIHPNATGQGAWAQFLLPYMKGEKD